MTLSICIPTYNRSIFLPTTVNSIIDSINFSQAENVELIISDNASTDDTPTVIENLIKRYPFIKSYRNEKNVMDENFFIAAKLATGKYVWVFADDDLMELEAVATVLKATVNDFNLIILNYSIWDQYIKSKLLDSRYVMKDDLELYNCNEVLSKFSMGPQFISAIIVKRDKFLSINKYDYRKLHQFGNSFLYAVYCSIKEDCKTLYLSKHYLKYRGFNSDLTTIDKWYKYFVYGNNFLLMLLKQEGYKTHAIRNARKKIITYYLARDIVARKKNNQNTLILLKKIPAIFYTHLSYCAICLPIIFLPNSVFKFLYSFKNAK